jgi:signal transduction histidine kinase
VSMIHSDKTLRVLSLEDSDLVLSELKKLKMKLIYKTVTSLSDLDHQIRNHPWNFVICPLHLGSFGVLDALDIVRSHSIDLPFVLFADALNEERVADLMKAGIEDIVLKKRIERLRVIVKRLQREQEFRDKEEKARKIATEAFAAKEQMLAVVSHDIKNPLSAIQLEAQMLLRAAEKAEKSLLSEEVKIQSNRILKTTERMKNLISDLLDKNKSENSLAHLCRGDVDCMKLLQEVLDSMRPLIQEKDLSLNLTIPSTVSMNIDRNKIFQVFANLINNAIKFSPAGGVIKVLMEENDHEFLFHFEDCGPGLKDKELNRVFEKYWTGNSADCSGTGLGLFICKTIVEAHGGQIFVQNLSQGARFSFSVPKVESEDKSYRPSLEHNDRKKVFIVDDDEDLREVMSWALGKEGYDIHAFASPEEALRILDKGRFTPNLIVVDYHMDEMKGSDFVVKKNNIPMVKNCPVVMISASPQDVQKEIPAELYKDVITKPIDLEGLVDNVRKFLN